MTTLESCWQTQDSLLASWRNWQTHQFQVLALERAFRFDSGRGHQQIVVAKNNMNFDERLDRLAQRHEALSETLEIVAGMQQANEKQLAEVMRGIAELTANSKRNGEHILALVRTAELHDRRLSNLEG